MMTLLDVWVELLRGVVLEVSHAVAAGGGTSGARRLRVRSLAAQINTCVTESILTQRNKRYDSLCMDLCRNCSGQDCE
jgi:hypothetical protein